MTVGMQRQLELVKELIERERRETASLKRTQAELFEQTLGALRAPTNLARSVLGAERRPRRDGG